MASFTFRRCGTACHVGVATGLPTLGVAKNLHLIEDLGLEGGKGDAARRLKESFRGVEAVGHQVPLVTQKGRILGSAVKSSQESKNPIFVSVGSGLTLMTAVSLVIAVSRQESRFVINVMTHIIVGTGYLNQLDRQTCSQGNTSGCIILLLGAFRVWISRMHNEGIHLQAGAGSTPARPN